MAAWYTACQYPARFTSREVEAKCVEECEVCWGWIQRRQDHRMMEVLVTVQSKRRVRQPAAATFEDVIRHVFVAHPREFNIGEGLGDALDNSILHGHAIGECLVTDSSSTNLPPWHIGW